MPYINVDTWIGGTNYRDGYKCMSAPWHRQEHERSNNYTACERLESLIRQTEMCTVYMHSRLSHSNLSRTSKWNDLEFPERIIRFVLSGSRLHKLCVTLVCSSNCEEINENKRIMELRNFTYLKFDHLFLIEKCLSMVISITRTILCCPQAYNHEQYHTNISRRTNLSSGNSVTE